jgi:hypothetical protein
MLLEMFGPHNELLIAEVGVDPGKAILSEAIPLSSQKVVDKIYKRTFPSAVLSHQYELVVVKSYVHGPRAMKPYDLKTSQLRRHRTPALNTRRTDRRKVAVSVEWFK